jgi:hypothetical protein
MGLKNIKKITGFVAFPLAVSFILFLTGSQSLNQAVIASLCMVAATVGGECVLWLITRGGEK